MRDASAGKNHYEMLGLDRACTPTQIRDAYRLLAKRLHPDVNDASPQSQARLRALNASYEILRDPSQRRAYDRKLDHASRAAASPHREKIERNFTQDLRLRIEDFLRGTILNVQLKDPANPAGEENYRAEIPAMTAPGARLTLPRHAGGVVRLRLKAMPGFRFQVRGSDLRTDLRISPQRAEQGGSETVERPGGGMLRVTIPKRAKRGEIIRVPGEGLPKARGGRGDLLVRLTYRLDARVTRAR